MSDTPSQPKNYRISIRRPVAVAMLFVTLMVFGWQSYGKLPINLMPDISYPTLTVRTEYEGAAPEDVEKLVTRPVEERLSVVSGVEEVSSVSSAGLSEIVLEFKWGTDMNLALQDVRESLDMFDAPQDLRTKPIILRYDPTLDPVMRIAITGRDFSEITDPAERERRERADLTEIRESTERHVKQDLEAEVGIAQVEVKGGREEEIQILIDAERLKNLRLSPQMVVSSLGRQNINLSGGRLKEGKTEYLVRTLNEFKDVDQIRAVVIQTPTGEQIRLEELAVVQMGEKELENVVRLNGREAVELEIFKEGDANTVEVCDQLRDFFGFERPKNAIMEMIVQASQRVSSERAKKMMEEAQRQKEFRDQLKSRLPSYIEKAVVTDQSRFIKASIREVRDAAVTGAILSLLVLFLFLQEMRSTLIIAVATPISVMATFIPLYMGHVSLNIMSLGGLALGIGMLVDNSIVVLESIFRCREEGDGFLEGAERGTREVAPAVTASTLTTIAVFAPIVFVEGIAGQLFRDLALTVTFSLIASLIVALYLVPMMASRQTQPLSSQDQVVWIVKGYLEARERRGKGRIRALLEIPASGVRYARAWLLATWRSTVTATFSGTRAGSGPGYARAASLAGLPIVVLLFAIQVVLKLAAAVLITVFFFISMSFFGVYWIIARLLGLILMAPARLFDKGFRVFRELYGVTLRAGLRFSPILLVLFLGVAVHSAWIGRTLGRELIPPMKQGEFGIRIEAPPGTRLEDTEARASAIENIVRESPYVDTATVQVGSDSRNTESTGGENIASFTIKLRDPETTVQIQDEIIEDIRQRVVAATPDQVTFTLPTMFSFKTAVELEIYGEGLNELRDLGTTALAALEGVPGLKDVELSLKKGHPEIIISPDRDLLAAKGLGPDAIARLLRTEVGGDIATRFSRGGDKIDIRVRTDDQRLKSRQDLANLSVTDNGPPTPLSAVATITTQPGPSEIRRINQRQVVVISANVEGRDLGSVAADMQARLDQIYWPQGYYYLMGGQQEELQNSYQGLVFALVLSLFLVYVVMACQFESIVHPALIMFTAPLALIGVVYALKYESIDVSVTVFIGAIVLGGIVVNAAIVMVDYVNQLRERGLSKTDAIVESCKTRLRPILMTTLTTILGLVPMAFSSGEGSEMRRPLAMTVMAGLSSATLLTLFVIPMLYQLLGGRDRRQALP